MLLVLHDRPGAARAPAAHLAEGAVYEDLGALLSYGNLCLSQGARDGAVGGLEPAVREKARAVSGPSIRRAARC